MGSRGQLEKWICEMKIIGLKGWVGWEWGSKDDWENGATNIFGQVGRTDT